MKKKEEVERRQLDRHLCFPRHEGVSHEKAVRKGYYDTGKYRSHRKEVHFFNSYLEGEYPSEEEIMRWTYDQQPEDKQKLKLILMLREPVARDLSWFNHLLCFNYTGKASSQFAMNNIPSKDARELGTFDRYVEEILIPRLQSAQGLEVPLLKKQYGKDWDVRQLNSPLYGLYSKWIPEWIAKFDRVQLLVLSYDELQMDPTTLHVRISHFLFSEDEYIARSKAVMSANQHSNTQSCPLKVSAPTCAAQTKLAEVYRKSNEEVVQLVNNTRGPAMEEHPLRHFEMSSCLDD